MALSFGRVRSESWTVACVMANFRSKDSDCPGHQVYNEVTVIERNHARSGLTRIALTVAVVICGASSSSLAGLVASDSYLTGSDPTSGQYTPFVSGGTTGSLFSGQSASLANTGFVNGGYTHGTITNNFIASSTGLTSAADGASSTTSGSVSWQ